MFTEARLDVASLLADPIGKGRVASDRPRLMSEPLACHLGNEMGG